MNWWQSEQETAGNILVALALLALAVAFTLAMRG
jgi:hypothetical protein